VRRAVPVFIVCLGWALLNAVWLVRHRAGQPLNIDEAGYLGIALNEAFGWERAGPVGWVHSLLWPSAHAPLTTGLTSVALLTDWDPVTVSLGVILTFAVVTLALTAALATVTRSRAVVVLSLVIVSTTPGFIAFARTYAFAIPASAVTMAALYALVRSRALTSLPWSMAFGTALGLLPLARTMTIAFLPVLLAVAIAQAAAHPGSRRKQVVNLGIALVLGIAIASVWLVPSAHVVFSYLTSYGYGSHSTAYANGASSPPLALLSTLATEYFLPHLLLIAAGWCAAAWWLAARLRGGAVRSRARDIVGSPLFPPAMLVIGGSAALMTTRNAGSGFTIPLLAPAAIVAAAGWSRSIRALHGVGWRRVALAAISVGCIVLAYPSFNAKSILAVPRYFRIPGAAPLIVTEGRDFDPAYFTASRNAVVNDHESGGQWAKAFDRLISDALDNSTTRPDVALGFRGYFANVNVIEVGSIERLHYPIPVAQIDPLELGVATSAYASWLTAGDAASSCHLMTSPGAVNEFRPLVDTARLVTAASEVGFTAVDRVPLPDGRSVTVWERHGKGC
jgi:4-amino-4-deoxy-L-arabinose transferase-like glycosyltransferase